MMRGSLRRDIWGGFWCFGGQSRGGWGVSGMLIGRFRLGCEQWIKIRNDLDGKSFEIT